MTRRFPVARGPILHTVLYALLLIVILAILFPSVFLRGHYISPADILYASPPWNAYRPAGFERPQNPIMADVVTLFYPMYWETERSFERGEWPLWNRLELGGMPLLANYETAIFYPPRLLYRIFDVPLAMTLHILVKLWLCGMTAFICARGLALSTAASRFFSVAWMLGTYNVMFAPWCLPDVSAWLPILFLGVHRIAEGRYRNGTIIGTIGAILLMFAGHPELAFAAAAGVGVYFIARVGMAWRNTRHVLRALGACALVWCVALLVTSVQIVPFLEYLANSSDSLRHNIVKGAWFRPGHLVTYWTPRFYGLFADYNFWGDSHVKDYSMLYPGVAVWIGIGALFIARRAALRPLPVSLGIACGALLMLAFQMPPTAALSQLPVLESMAAYWYAVYPIFALPLLAAIGLDRWSAQSPGLGPIWRGLWIPGLGAAILLIALRFYERLLAAAGQWEYVSYQALVAIAFIVVCTVALIAGTIMKRHTAVVSLLTVVLAADLIYAARGVNPTLEPEAVYPRTALTDYLAALPDPTRVGIAQAQIVSGIMVPYGIEEWLGYDGLYPARVMDFQIRLAKDVWNAMEPACAIQYYLHDPLLPPQFPLNEPGRFSLVHQADGIQVHRNNRALPHAFFSAGVEALNSEDAIFDRMRSPDFNPREVALVLESDVDLGENGGESEPGTALVEERRGTYVRVRTETPSTQVLTLADAYYPGWTVTIDGKPARLFPVFHAFRGTVVPAGIHVVEYWYRPRSFYVPLGLSTVMLVALAVLGLVRLRGTPMRFDSARAV